MKKEFKKLQNVYTLHIAMIRYVNQISMRTYQI